MVIVCISHIKKLYQADKEVVANHFDITMSLSRNIYK